MQTPPIKPEKLVIGLGILLVDLKSKCRNDGVRQDPVAVAGINNTRLNFHWQGVNYGDLSKV